MNYNTRTYPYAPQPTPNTRGAFNTAIAEAQASADPRFNMKALDRPGVSRGAGTMATAGVQAAENLVNGIAKAYQTAAQDATTDANNTLQYESNNENFGQGVSSIAMQNDYANALAALQRAQGALQFQGNVLGGLLGGNYGSFGTYDGTY